MRKCERHTTAISKYLSSNMILIFITTLVHCDIRKLRWPKFQIKRNGQCQSSSLASTPQQNALPLTSTAQMPQGTLQPFPSPKPQAKHTTKNRPYESPRPRALTNRNFFPQTSIFRPRHLRRVPLHQHREREPR